MTQSQSPNLFKSLILLTFFVIFLQIAILLSKVSASGVASITIAKSLIQQFIATPAVSTPFFIYLGTQLLLQFAFTCLIWMMTRTIAARYNLSATATYTTGILLWLIYTALIFIANTLTFNYSVFALFNVTQPSSAYLYATYSALLAPLVLLAFTKAWRPVSVTILLFSLCYTLIEFRNNYLAPIKTTSADKPSIIMISIEALRPEYVTDMPFINSMLNSNVTSTVVPREGAGSSLTENDKAGSRASARDDSVIIKFTDNYTPIAQSFPSWISVLTSRTPLHQGARGLYANYANIDLHGSLISKLHNDGYQTVYAVDGQRFGEITSAIGFDNIISPPYGAQELLIGTISDFPLSNLLTLTQLGKYLFPYSYANRSVAVTYQPQDYLNMLQTNLRDLPNKPLFMVAHFSLSHWPYRWTQDQKPAKESIEAAYKRSLRAADQQIKSFYQLLETDKLLEHSIIILMSDHGMGLGLQGDSFGDEKKYVGNKAKFPALIKNPYSDNSQQSGYDTSYNYSTNIMSLRQYHTLLAMKFTGVTAPAKKVVTTRTSLMDIAPTLTSILKIPADKNWDGVSLFSTQPHRAFYMENGFTTPEITEANIDTNRLFETAVHWVQVDKSGLLSLTDSAQQKLVAKKQRSLLVDNWLLARLDTKELVLVNIENGKWTSDFSSDFAKSAPLAMMLKQFNEYNTDM